MSASRLHLDVLELIFTHLPSGADLASVALVCRAFFAGVIPRLYATLRFRLRHAKRYAALVGVGGGGKENRNRGRNAPGMGLGVGVGVGGGGQKDKDEDGDGLSPFAALVRHPEYAVHVRCVDITSVPTLKSVYHPRFLAECTRALALCTNLVSFRCTTQALPPLLPALAGKERLREVRVYAGLGSEGAGMLVKVGRGRGVGDAEGEGLGQGTLRALTLDYASWNVLGVLPEWAKGLKGLTTLVLYMAQELNDVALEGVLEELPGLKGLHVVGCMKVDHVAVLGLLGLVPELESLSMTTGEGSRILPTPPPHLPHLKHLALDARLSSSQPPSHTVLANILTHLSGPVPSTLPPTSTTSPYHFSFSNTTAPAASARARTATGPALTSFIARYPDRQIAVPLALVNTLVALHGASLRSVGFTECVLGTHDALPAVSRGCPALESLEVGVPVRDMAMFTIALAHSHSIRVLFDAASGGGGHHAAHHAPRPSLSRDSVRHLFGSVESLERVVCGEGAAAGGRVWSRTKPGPGDGFQGFGVALERRAGGSMAGSASGSGAAVGGDGGDYAEMDAAFGVSARGSGGTHWFMPWVL